MPRYTYRCEECDKYFETSHGMTEIPSLNCECGEILVKVPSLPLLLEATKIDSKTGDVVKTSIEEFKKDLKEQRKEASEREV